MGKNRCFHHILPFCLSLVFALQALPCKVEAAGDAALPEASGRSFAAEMPLRRLGGLELNDASFVVSDNTAEIQVIPPGLFDRRAVLSGPVIKLDVAGQTGRATAAGLVYFVDGAWLKYLDSAKASAVIETTDGARLVGNISGANEDSVDLTRDNGNTLHIRFASIRNIQAARAFSFSFPIADPPLPAGGNQKGRKPASVSLVPTLGAGAGAPAIVLPKVALPGDEKGISNRSMAALIFLDFCSTIAPAIVAPVVLGHHLNGAGTVLRDANLRSANGK